MLKTYLKIAWRNLLRNRTFSFINITGLSIGLGCFLLIALYVLDELSYDRYYNKAGNIYRINEDARLGRPGASHSGNLRHDGSHP